MCAMKPISITHARLIEDWVVGVLRQYMQVVDRPVSLPIPILDIGERLFALRCDVEDLKGRLANALGVLIPQKRWIILNRRQHPSRLAFTLAHELAHWLIDGQEPPQGDHGLEFITGLRSDDNYIRDRRANYVAAALLMPRQILLDEVCRLTRIGRAEVSELSKIFGVSHQAMKLRLSELGCTLGDWGIRLPLSDIGNYLERIEYQRRSANANIRRSQTVLVKADYSFIDYTLYRKLSSLKRNRHSLYALFTGQNTDIVEVLLDLDCVDGFAVLGDALAQDLKKQHSDDSYRDVIVHTLERGKWLDRLLADDAIATYGNRADACVVYLRSDGQFSSRQQTLLDASKYIVPAIRLNHRQDARRFIRSAKEAGKRVVVATGCFDLITISHVRFLRRAKAAGDVLVVGLEDDIRVRAFKGPLRPVNTISQRVELMNAFDFVDFVFVISGSPRLEIKPFYTRLHKTLKADILAVTEYDPYLQDRRDEIETAGGELVVVSRYEGASSTSLIRRFLAETEISDLLIAPKHRPVGYVAGNVAQNQTHWRQLKLPLGGSG
jgi:cytidyltransferase-like protein